MIQPLDETREPKDESSLEPEPDVDDMLLLPLHINEAPLQMS